MKHIKYTCDRCRKEIDDLVYTLICCAQDLDPYTSMERTKEVVNHNRQNSASMNKERHLCRVCKDAITDGIFIV